MPGLGLGLGSALASVIGLLRKLLEELLAETRRTKRVASNRAAREEDWGMEKGGLREATKGAL